MTTDIVYVYNSDINCYIYTAEYHSKLLKFLIEDGSLDYTKCRTFLYTYLDFYA